MESVTTDKPDVSCTSDDEHLGSSTANGFSVIHSYLSKRSYPTCLCVTAFQLVHFQIAYHSSRWSYITPVIRNGIAADMTSSTATGRNSRLQTLRNCNSILCGNVWVKPPPPPTTLTTTKVQCEGCSTRFVVICSSSDADNWKCAPLVLCIGHLRFCFLFLFNRLGQHTLHNFHLLLTAVRVTNYNIMYGGPNLTRGASKC